MNFILSISVWIERLRNKSVFPQLNSHKLQRFYQKFSFLLFLTISLTITANAATFTVDTLLDNESNGCGTGVCTLREAINDANALAGSDTINFAPALSGTITLDGSFLSISSDITINGPGARTLAVSGNDLSRVFVIRGSSTTANISGLTITNGCAFPLSITSGLSTVVISDGGAILNTFGGTLNLTDVTVQNSHSPTLGGGVATRAILLTVANTTITRSTISNNNATGAGGGISNLATSLVSFATTNVNNSTISDNTTLAAGGGIANTTGELNLTNNTISDNKSVAVGGGIANVTAAILGVANVRNNIIARNSAVVGIDLISSDALGVFNSQGNNLIGDNVNVTASFAASAIVGGIHQPNLNADLVGSIGAGFQRLYPLIGNLQNNGGPTDTRLPLTNSLALDNGNNCVTDGSCGFSFVNEQRGAGFPRILNSTVDIGATEGPAAPNSPYIVTTLADDESDGCSVNQCTLREAITHANVAPDFDTINFTPTLQGTLTLNGNQLVISSNVTINGLGARKLKISGDNKSRVFLIAAPILGGSFEVDINNLTVTEGSALPIGKLAGDGGGILNGALLGIISGNSTLRLNNVNVSRNFATTLGGGIATRLGSTTIITNSLISNNYCQGVPLVVSGDVGGGGVSNVALSRTVIANSTITNNNTLVAGGGILNIAGDVDLTNNTITHNQSTLLGGGVVSVLAPTAPFGGVNLRNTIIAKNLSVAGTNLISSDVLGVLGAFNSLGNNFIGNNVNAEANFEASVFVGLDPQPNANADLVGNVVLANQIIDPMLTPLRHYGGHTNVRLPLPGSPVLNQGNNCVENSSCASNNPPISLTFDQRGTGFPRVVNSVVEIGATEGPTNTVALIVTTLADNESDGCGTNECTLREAIEEANTDIEFDEINFQPGLSGTIPLNGNELVISSNVLINGQGARDLTVDAQDQSRVFMVATPILGGDFEAEINKMTITGGMATPVTGLAGDGGGVLNGARLGILDGTSILTLREVNIFDNEATTRGGGVATGLGSETIIVNSLVNQNTSNAVPFLPGGNVGGGGVSNVLSSTIIANSTIANNDSLAGGGGIFNVVGRVYSTNNTITLNESDLVGGGIRTVMDNAQPLDVTYLRNTIIAENTSTETGSAVNSNVSGTAGSFTSYGNNLIEDNAGGETDFPPSIFNGADPLPNAKLDLVGSDLTQLVSPVLSPLQNNGGPTDSRVPSGLSPAMNSGNNCVVTNSCAVNPDNKTPHQPLETDQRGNQRQSNSNVEMGSTEEPLTPTAANVSINGRVLSENGYGLNRVNISLTDSSGTIYTTTTNHFGYFRLENLPAGDTFVLTAMHRTYEFEAQLLTISEDIIGLTLMPSSSTNKTENRNKKR